MAIERTRVRVKLGDLRANPFKKKIAGGRLDPEKIKILEQSIREFGFWDCLVGRMMEDGKIEIAFGHHRLAAAINVLGKDYETYVGISPCTDDEMIRTMALDMSTTEGHDEQELFDYAVEVYKKLKKHPCTRNHRHSVKSKPERCLVAMLGLAWEDESMRRIGKQAIQSVDSE